MIQNYDEIVRTFYGQLKEYKPSSFKSLRSEMTLMGMSVTEDVAYALASVVQNSDSLNSAAERVATMNEDALLSHVKLYHDTSEVTEFVVQENEILSKKDAKKREIEIKKDELKQASADKERASYHAMIHSDNTYMSEYKICSAADMYALQEEVNWYMSKNGYVPIGGVCTYPLFPGVRLSKSEHDRFFQAMVKYEYK